MPKAGSHQLNHHGEAAQPQVDRLVATVERLEADFRNLQSADLEWAAERSLLRAMIDQVPDYLFAKDLECRFLVVNKAVADIHGRAKLDDMIGKTDFDLHPAEVAERFFEIEQAVVRSGQPMIDMEEVVVDANGATRWLSTSKVALRNDRNEIIGLVGISRDVTARKQAELLREEQALVLEMIAMNAPLAEVLDHLVRLMEVQLPGVLGSILLLDEGGNFLRHGAAPNLPEAYSKAIDGVAIGPDVVRAVPPPIGGKPSSSPIFPATRCGRIIAIWQQLMDCAPAGPLQSCRTREPCSARLPCIQRRCVSQETSKHT